MPHVDHPPLQHRLRQHCRWHEQLGQPGQEQLRQPQDERLVEEPPPPLESHARPLQEALHLLWLQAERLRVEGDGLGVVLLGHGGVALGFQGLGLLLLVLGRLLLLVPGVLAAGGPRGGGRRGAEGLVGGVDLEEGLGPEDGGGGLRGRVDLEGLGDAVEGDVDGVLVLAGEGAVCGGVGEEVADGEGETLFGGEGSLRVCQ